jgi:hypothetical protein
VNSRIAITASYGLTGLLTSLWGSTLPATVLRLAISSTELGIVLTTLAVGGLIAMPLTGRLAEAWSGPRTLRIAAPGAALALLGPTLSPTIGWLIGSTFVFGLSLGALNVSLSLQAVAVERAMSRPIISTMQGVWTLGAVAGGSAVSVALRVGLSVQVIMAIGSATLAVAATAIGAAARNLGHLTAQPKPAGGLPVQTNPRKSLVLALGLIGSAGFIAEGAATDWAGVHAIRVLGADAATGSLVYAVFFATMTGVRFLGDALRGRLGAAKTMRLAGGVASLGFGLVLLASILNAPIGTRVGCAIAGWSLAGAGMALVWPIVVSTLGVLSGAERTLSSVTAISYGGGLIGPALIGFVAGASTLPIALLIPTAAALLVVSVAPRVLGAVARI